MKAVSELAVASKPAISTSNKGVEKAPSDSLWAVIRRIKAQVAEMEVLLSVVRRDVARIDRRQLRDNEKLPSELKKAAEAGPGGVANPQGIQLPDVFGRATW